jgi:hypothetical protein
LSEELQEGQKQHFTLSDVLAIPETASQQLTRTFTDRNGREWTITIRADGKTFGDEFYKLINLSQRAAMECGAIPGISVDEDKIGLSVHLPDPVAPEIHITDPGYLSQIYVLAAVAINPKFTPEEWIIFGHKIQDPNCLEDILDWASDENGVSEWFAKKLAKLGNAKGPSSSHSKKGSGGRASGTPNRRRK